MTGLAVRMGDLNDDPFCDWESLQESKQQVIMYGITILPALQTTTTYLPLYNTFRCVTDKPQYWKLICDYVMNDVVTAAFRLNVMTAMKPHSLVLGSFMIPEKLPTDPLAKTLFAMRCLWLPSIPTLQPHVIAQVPKDHDNRTLLGDWFVTVTNARILQLVLEESRKAAETKKSGSGKLVKYGEAELKQISIIKSSCDALVEYLEGAAASAMLSVHSQDKHLKDIMLFSLRLIQQQFTLYKPEDGLPSFTKLFPNIQPRAFVDRFVVAPEFRKFVAESHMLPALANCDTVAISWETGELMEEMQFERLSHLQQWNEWYWAIVQHFGISKGIDKFVNVCDSKEEENARSWFVRVMVIIMTMLHYDESFCPCLESRLLTMLLLMQRTLDWSLQYVQRIVHKQVKVQHDLIRKAIQPLRTTPLLTHSCKQSQSLDVSPSIRKWLITMPSSQESLPGVWKSALRVAVSVR